MRTYQDKSRLDSEPLGVATIDGDVPRPSPILLLPSNLAPYPPYGSDGELTRRRNDRMCSAPSYDADVAQCDCPTGSVFGRELGNNGLEVRDRLGDLQG